MNAINDVERDLIDGMNSFLEDLKSDEPIEKAYTCRRVAPDLALHSSKEQGRRQLTGIPSLKKP